MRRFVALAVVLLGALACVTAAQAGNTTITNFSAAASYTVVVPCANGGAGEVVDISGTEHDVIRNTINGNNFSDTFHQNGEGLTGTGETTGNTYHETGAVNASDSGSLTNGQANSTFTLDDHYLSQGSAPNFLVHVTVHVTVNANGDVTVTFVNFRAECSP
jgi:hypothetical protein